MSYSNIAKAVYNEKTMEHPLKFLNWKHFHD